MIKKIVDFAIAVAVGRAKSRLFWRFPLAYGAWWLYKKYRERQTGYTHGMA